MSQADPKDIPQVEDKRPKIAGLLPKNTQTRVLGGIALLMILVILFSGHNAPKEKAASSSSPGNAVTEPSQVRIQDYRTRIEEQVRRLAAEEAELTKTKAALGAHPGEPVAALPASRAPTYGASYGAAPVTGPEAEKDWIERDRQKREYQALFASNIALSHRRETPEATSANPAPSVAPTPSTEDSRSVTDGGNRAQQYRLFEGTILETVLTNRVDSSFSGPVNCMVTTNVYSHDGLKLLIPQGSRILGEVRKLESYGEQRLAVFFHRLIMSDGFSVSLDQFKGLDQIGATGLQDQINHHYLQLFGVSIGLGVLAGLSQSNTRYGVDQSAAQAYQQGVASSLSQSSLHILDRYLNVLPTSTIREGYRIKVYLAQDLMLPGYDQHSGRNDL